jgi:hypothetical protein
MYYLIYETTNLINGNFYVGAHQTKNLNDGYLGSGKYFRHALKKYGDSNFSRKILFEFDNQHDMFVKENEIVDEEFVSRKDTYNIKLGGSGGFDHLNYGTAKSKNLRFDPEYQKNISWLSHPEKYGVADVQEWRRRGQKKIQELIDIGKFNPTKWFDEHPKIRQKGLDKMNSPEAMTKRIKTFHAMGHQQGSKNSQYGTCWITNEIENKKIKKENISEWFNKGWKFGRIKTEKC